MTGWLKYWMLREAVAVMSAVPLLHSPEDGIFIKDGQTIAFPFWSFLYFMRRFWNQILICRSVSFSSDAISRRRGRHRYALKWNSFSSSSSWVEVKAVRIRFLLELLSLLLAVSGEFSSPLLYSDSPEKTQRCGGWKWHPIPKLVKVKVKDYASSCPVFLGCRFQIHCEHDYYTWHLKNWYSVLTTLKCSYILLNIF